MAQILACLPALPGYHHRVSITGSTIINLNHNNMKPNMGNADRIIRVLIAAVLAYLYFSGTVTGTLGLILVIVGAVFVLTSLVGFCPLYTLVGLNTCPKKKV